MKELSRTAKARAAAAGVAIAAAAAGCQGLLGLGDATIVVGDDAGDASLASDSAMSAEGSTAPDTSVAPSIDATTDSPVDAPAVDAVADSPAPLDAGSDAPTDSPATPLDAADAGDSATSFPTSIAEPSVPCANQGTPFFCDDFDDVTDVSHHWDWMYLSTDAGSITLDTTVSSSPPNSALFVDPVVAAAQEVQLGKGYSPFTQWVRLAFDMRIDATTMAGIPQVAVGQVLTNNAPATSRSINYVIDGTPAAYAQDFIGQSFNATGPALPVPPLKTWTRIVVVYDVTLGAGFYEDGKLIGTDPAVAGVPIPGGSGIVGGAYMNPPGSVAASIEIDNVVIRGQ